MRSRDAGATTRALALAGLVPAALLLPGHPFAAGGLGGLAGGLVIGALAGAPAARAEWHEGALPPGVAARVAEVTGVLAAGAALGQLAADAVGAAGLLLGLGAVGLAVYRFGPPALRAVLVLAGAALLGATSVAATPYGPWTLLEPRPEIAREAAGIALLFGVLLAGAGLEGWSGAPWIPGVGARRPFLPVGLMALAGLAALAEIAWRAERSAALPVDPSRVGVVAAALFALGAAGAVLSRPGGGWTRAAGLAAATAWFAGPGGAALPFFWLVCLPIGLAVALAARGPRGRVLAALVGVGVVLAWPGLPATAGAAVAASLTVVAAFWAVATERALARVTA